MCIPEPPEDSGLVNHVHAVPARAASQYLAPVGSRWIRGRLAAVSDFPGGRGLAGVRSVFVDDREGLKSPIANVVQAKWMR